MRRFSLVLAAVLSTIAPCFALVPGSLFRHAFECSDRGPLSVCVYGSIPRGKQVTVLAKGWKSSAMTKESWPNDNNDFQNGAKTITRLQVTTPPPKDAALIAILADASAVNELPLEEVHDDAAVEKISQYIKTTNALNLAPDIHVLKTRLLRLSPTILLSETFLAPPDDVAALEKELPTGCGDCDSVPLLVGQTLADLFKETRSNKVNVEHTCGGLRVTFAVSGRPFVLSHSSSCESDSFSATLVHDLSGAKPKLVFKIFGGF